MVTLVVGHTHSLMLLVLCRLSLPPSPPILVWLDKIRSWLHCGRRTHTLSYAACFVQALAAIITPHFSVAG